jgi:alkanesulfonate monooxygenase SsuD/methylene tetrahydromethanopterin reductase-like flavin-dependent oxidoreductase (luciferase family)
VAEPAPNIGLQATASSLVSLRAVCGSFYHPGTGLGHNADDQARDRHLPGARAPHHPLLLAKQVATLDNFSGGRFLFGIGAGWLNEETAIMGGDFAHRWGQTREAILAMKALWTQETAEFHGKYDDFPPVISFPKPVQPPHPPIYIGASGMGHVFRRVVPYGNARMPWMFTPQQIRQGRAILNDLARDAGRGPHAIEVVAMPVPAEPDVLKAYEDAEADGAVVLVMPATEAQRWSKPQLDTSF